jgi:hypothetical protein
MQINELVRTDTVIKECMMELDNALVAKTTCAIIVPFRFLQAGLLELGKNNYVATIFPVVNTANQYTVCNVCTKMEIVSRNIEITKFNGEDFYVFNYEKGDVICPDLELVKDDNFSYKIYQEIVQKAKAPWFLNYADIGKVMATAGSHSGVQIPDTNAIYELIVAALSRNEDMTMYYRHVVDGLEDRDFIGHPLNSVALNSIIYATNNKMNKLMGGYIEDGLTSALTESTSATSEVELLLRKK